MCADTNQQLDIERDEASCTQIKVGQDPEAGQESNAAVLRSASDEIGQRAGDNQQDSVTQTLEDVDNETLLKFSRSLFKHSPSAIIIYEVHGDGAAAADYEIVEANEVCLRTEGWDRSIIGKRLGDLRPAADEFGIIQAFQHVHLTGEVTMFPAKIYREAGQETWFENRIFRLPTGEVVSIYSDITETKQRELHIEYLSRHDSLTGLLNRSAFEEMLNGIEQEGEFPYTVIIGDLDGLKLINDAFGHGVGDEVLKQATDILRKACREDDALCRWGGDEFIVLLRNADENVGHAICNRIRKACKKTAIAHTEGTSISLSLGSATRVSPDEDWREALRNAESAMYKSKLLDTKSYRNVILTSIKNTLFEKSFETEEHGERMAKYCRVMGERIGLGDSVLDELEVLGMLHDIGKIAIDDQILKKPSALTFEEFEKMKRHPEAGYRIASTIPELAGVADYILAHHERWDGTGYPAGLAGEAIPLAARIMSVADAYDAMTSNRPYRKALTEQEAREELRVNAGSQFDPAIVRLFLDYLQEA